MNSSIAFMLLLQVVLIGLNAIFACAETATISMNDNKLAKMAEDGDKRAIRLVHLTSEPARFLATIQVAITLSGFLGSAFAAENFSTVLVDWVIGLGVAIPRATLESIAVILITLVLSYFTLVFGELVPKRVAMNKAEAIALGLSGLISGVAAAFKPIVGFLTASTNAILIVMGIDPNEETDEVNEEEIRMMVDVGSEKGTIDHDEKEFIQNVFEFDDLTAGEIVTHRTETTMLWMEDSAEEWKRVIYESRYNLYPICENSADNIVGILKAKDYLRLENKEDKENVLQQAVKPAYFVPETVKADVLFKNMKRTRNKLAVVLDEYGGMSGILTLNDLVEQLVGDLGDDEIVEEEVALIEKIDERTWKINGRASIEEVAAELEIVLPCDEHETFNGLVFDTLGNIPDDGTTVELDVADLHIEVTDICEHQIRTAIVHLVEKETETEAEKEEE
ncbi:MAG: HlyC/CorC family transporter [Roseburia sp.]|nr:HlyC/CorC family transporter [Roseburia sp.]